MILCCLCSYSQSLVLGTPGPVASGSIVTFKAEGETADAYFRNFNFDFTKTVSTSPNAYSAGYVHGELQQILLNFNSSTKIPSAITVKVSNRAPFPITVKFFFRVYLQTTSITNPYSDWETSVEVTVNPVPTVFYNVAKTQVFTKNNCPAGTAGSQYTHTIPAGKHQAATQAEADAMAQNDLVISGQNLANNNGTCLQLYDNTAQTASFTRNNCPPNSASSELIPFTISAGRFQATSLTEANRKALDALNVEGQANANATAACVKAIIYAKLVLKNYTSVVGGVDENGNPVPGGSINSSVKKGDYYVELFSDAALTIPFNATNFTVTAKITTTTTREFSNYYNPSRVTVRNVNYTVNGDYKLIEREFIQSLVNGTITNYRNKIELTAGDYIIAN